MDKGLHFWPDDSSRPVRAHFNRAQIDARALAARHGRVFPFVVAAVFPNVPAGVDGGRRGGLKRSGPRAGWVSGGGAAAAERLQTQWELRGFGRKKRTYSTGGSGWRSGSTASWFRYNVLSCALL